MPRTRLWLVDWDLPRVPTRHRKRFYYHLKKLMKELDGDTIHYSSMSVLVTHSRELAVAIHSLARDCSARRTSIYGITNLRLIKKYEAEAKNPEPQAQLELT